MAEVNPSPTTTQLCERLAMMHKIANDLDTYLLLYGSAMTVQMIEMFLVAAKGFASEYKREEGIWELIQKMDLKGVVDG